MTLKGLLIGLFVIFFILFSEQAQSQIRKFSQMATCDFEYKGELWKSEFGEYAADLFVQKMHILLGYNFWAREEVEKILRDSGISDLFETDVYELRSLLRAEEIQYFFAGKIKDLIQTVDVNGAAQVKAILELKIFAFPTAKTYVIGDARYTAHFEKQINTKDPFDKAAARRILNGLYDRLATLVRNRMERIEMMQPGFIP